MIRLEHRMLVRAGNPFQIVGRVDLDETKYILGSFKGIVEVKDVVEDFKRTEETPEFYAGELRPLRELMRSRGVLFGGV